MTFSARCLSSASSFDATCGGTAAAAVIYEHASHAANAFGNVASLQAGVQLFQMRVLVHG